jgi:hypothetical protein
VESSPAAVDKNTGRIYFSTASGFDPFNPQRPTGSGKSGRLSSVDGIVIVGAGVGERTGDSSDPSDIASRIPQNVTALCVPGTPHCE